jgi:hypothetical protein
MSDRASPMPGQLNIFKMDLKTGESVQLTESSDLLTKDSVVMTADGKEVFFFDKQNHLRVVEMESFRERTIAQLPEEMGPPDHNSTLTADKRFLLTPRQVEKPIRYGYVYSPWVNRSALVVIRTDNGQVQRLCEGMMPVGIAEYCPTDDNLLLWDLHAGWEECHRPWVGRADGTNNRPVMLTIKGETSGHQFWGWGGETIYSVISGGGRMPQGIWACGRDGESNQRCVMHGPTIAHCTTNPAEDRFVADEVFGQTDALWMSRRGSLQPEVLCQITDWFETREGVRQAKPYHPHSRFLPSGNAVAFNGQGNAFLVEL